MNQTIKRMISMILTLILMVSIAVPAFAASIKPREGTAIVYLTNSKGESGIVGVEIASGTKSFTIKRSSVSVRGAGAKMYMLQKYLDRMEFEKYANSSSKWFKGNRTSCDYVVRMLVRKTGITTIKYKIGSKAYSLRVKIIPYENPIKKITLNGVNGNKSFASMTNNRRHPNKSLTLKKDTKNAKLVVTPASGWKISSIKIEDEKTGLVKQISREKPMSSATLSWGTLRADRVYNIHVGVVNPSLGFHHMVLYNVVGVNC